MVMVLTFVLAADESKRIDVALQEDAESRLVRDGRRFSTMTVRDVKRNRIREIKKEVTRRCLKWVNNVIPGTLSATAERLGPPTCALLSLAVGKPFATDAEYMALLRLGRPLLVEKFVSHDFLFLMHLLDRSVEGWMTAAFNETDALGSEWLRDPGDVPELFHVKISSLMIADGLNAALQSFWPRLQSIRTDLNRLDIDEPARSQVIGLRNRLLGLTREISIICGDVTVFINDALIVWADFSPLIRVKLPGDSSAPVEITANSKRQELRAVVESLQAQEMELRESTLVTTSAVNETRAIKLNNRLGQLTWVLVGLTVALVFIGIVQLVVTAQTGLPPRLRVLPQPHELQDLRQSLPPAPANQLQKRKPWNSRLKGCY